MLAYDLKYYDKTLRLNSKTAEHISKIRWAWLSDIPHNKVLDYGCGVGWFRAWKPEQTKVWSYDVGVCPQTGIEIQIYDVICLWDVLEHIEDFTHLESLLRLSNAVAGTMPLKPRDVKYTNWKHFKPGEHVHYWDKEELDAYFAPDFKKIKDGYPECPPREDVLSFLYRRV